MKQDFLSLLKAPKMALIMALPKNDPELARISWESVADIVKVHCNVQHRVSKVQFGSFDEEKDVLLQILKEAKGPCGIVAGDNPAAVSRDYGKIRAAGFSFVSMYAGNMPPEIIQDDGVSRVAALGPDFTKEQAESMKPIGVDAVEASVMAPETYGQLLSTADLMSYYTIAKYSGLPVVVPTQHVIRKEDLQALSRCGTGALMIGAVVTGETKESIKKSIAGFREAIDRM